MKKKQFLARQSELFEELKSLTESKQNDYSAGIDDAFYNFNHYETLNICTREQGILSRICDKFTRLTGALGGNQLKNESVSDSILDMINYLTILQISLEERDS